MMNFLFIFGSLFIGGQLVIRVDAWIYEVGKVCLGGDNVTDTSERYSRQKSLADLRSNLTAKADNATFYNTTFGEPPYNLYGLFQCREDMDFRNCRRCVGEAAEDITGECPFHAEAIAWYEECMVRYTSHPILSTYETYPSFNQSNSGHVSNFTQFSEEIEPVMNRLINYTISQSPLFAASKNTLTSSDQVDLFCFAQCNRNIDASSCDACLRKALSQMRNCCSTSIKATVFFPSCQLRYSDVQFWMENMPLAPTLATPRAPTRTPPRAPPHAPPRAPPRAPPFTPPQAPSKDPGLGEKERRKLMIVASAALIGLVIIGAGLCLCRFKKHRRQIGIISPTDINSPESLQFDYKKIKAATSNFSITNKLGEGAFGVVYKGKLANGKEIAVKKLSKNTKQGTSEFQNEVLLVANLQHKNLVKLLGYCVSRKEQILIFEFLSNSSLDRFMNDPLKRASLGWAVRLNIITLVAMGLAYLHEYSRLITIIHRDMKSGNILLDEAMNAKIANFGVAKLFDLSQTQDAITGIAGTHGYIAPEYAIYGRLSVKCDVYSFGIIVLEIVSGQRNRFVHQQPGEGLIRRAWRLWKKGSILELVDPLLGAAFAEEEAKLCVQIALLCIQENPTLRPGMSSVVSALSGEPITLSSPNAPHALTIADLNDATSYNTYSLHWDEFQQRMFDHSKGVYTENSSSTEFYSR